MTEEGVVRWMRENPEKAVRAIRTAKVAGPWVPILAGSHPPQRSGAVARHAWSDGIARSGGLRVASDLGAQEFHDTALLRDGWVLANEIL